MGDKHYYVYIVASLNRTLYVGVTGNLVRRVRQHKMGSFAGFTAKYKVTRLVRFESYAYVLDAISREKQLKRWRREKKLRLVEADNPAWDDLAEDWFVGADFALNPEHQ